MDLSHFSRHPQPPSRNLLVHNWRYLFAIVWKPFTKIQKASWEKSSWRNSRFDLIWHKKFAYHAKKRSNYVYNDVQHMKDQNAHWEMGTSVLLSIFSCPYRQFAPALREPGARICSLFKEQTICDEDARNHSPCDIAAFGSFESVRGSAMQGRGEKMQWNGRMLFRRFDVYLRPGVQEMRLVLGGRNGYFLNEVLFIEGKNR